MRNVHVMISGRVQGVGFRYWVAGRAEALNVAGWVRNRRDGRVEAVFCGRDDAVEAMLASVAQGPNAARVDTIETVEQAGEALTQFEIRPTV